MTNRNHFTTRRGFIATAGFGGTALYGLWALYGVAPGPFDLIDAAPAPSAGAAGHAAHAGGGMDASSEVAAFEDEVRAFVARYEQPDGSVFPRSGPAAAQDAHAGHAKPAPASDEHDVAGPDLHAMHMPGMDMPTDHGTGHGAAQGPDSHAEAIVVPLLASRWFYEPSHLRLEVGPTYRFRMMATDVAHGASIQFGTGGRMIRLRPGQLVEQEFTFREPGELLVTCSFFCGAGHDAMQARISVVEGAKA
ncbi:hypothetical protein [Cereibacter sediminicola]|uniref:hypothetical protein n=1 Tax=Cereibacter sediminicola TaxID=2584941 RepID=UPI00119DD59A|nr:hypothetical protein [Cereibacter sediminicola]